MKNPTSASLENAARILNEGGADTEPIAQAMMEGFRAQESNIGHAIGLLSSPHATRASLPIRHVWAAAAVLSLLIVGSAFLIHSSIEKTNAAAVQQQVGELRSIVERQASLAQQAERSVIAASEAANRASRSSDEIERNVKDIIRLTQSLRNAEQPGPAQGEN